MKLISWGANQYSQLAHPGWPVSEQCETPQTCDTTGLPNDIADSLVQIIGGGGHTLLLDVFGRVWACGLNNKGQSGQPPKSSTDSGNLLRPWTQVDTGGLSISHVAAGWEHTLALTSDGILLGWGNNSHGQLGLQDGGTKGQPVQVAREVLHMAAGLRHSAWVTEEGKLRICGALKNMQTDLPECLKCIKVACGQRHVLALVSAEEGEEGQVWAVGDNRHKQLGIDKATSSQNIDVAECVIEQRFCQLSSGWSHAAAITGDGQVVCWGRNIYGQLGAEQVTQPVIWPTQHKAVQLALGSEHTLVRQESGTVVSCGWNEHGNCGNGDTKDIYVPTQILQGCKLIGCGAAHCFAVI